MQRNFLEKNSIKNKVEKKKEQFKTYFFSLWKGVQNEQCAANELATLIFNSIADSAHQLMERKIISVFKEHKSQSLTKYQLQLNALIILCEKENFNLYLLYITDPVGYIQKRLEQQLQLFYAKDEMRMIILESYNQEIIDLISFTIKAAREALGQINIEQSTKEQNTSVVTNYTWKNIFLKVIRDDIRNVSNTKLAIFDAYDIKDYRAFIQALSNSLFEKLKENNAEMPKDYEIFCDQILKDIITCLECCPYCNELCQRNMAGHEHHCGEFHRPLGLNGIKNDSNELIIQPCPNLVKKKRFFQLRKSKFANLDFSEGWLKTTKWRINEEESIDTHYWIWVMNRFHFEFEEYYKATAINLELTYFTKEEILSELRDKLVTVDSSNLSHEDDSFKFKLAHMLNKFFFFLFH